jgi:hypothetical protein
VEKENTGKPVSGIDESGHIGRSNGNVVFSRLRKLTEACGRIKKPKIDSGNTQVFAARTFENNSSGIWRIPYQSIAVAPDFSLL